jgi:DNA-binding NarL/FixJ family response regulator
MGRRHSPLSPDGSARRSCRPIAKRPLSTLRCDAASICSWPCAATALLASKAGSHFSDYVAPDSVAEAREVFARKVQGSHDSAVQRTTLITSVGLATVELASVPIRDGAEVVGVLALVRDERHVSSGRRRPKPRLTPRQQEVLELLADGRSTAEMAQRLGLSEETVRNHVRYLLAELRVRTRLEAVVTAFRNEWL